MKAKVADRGQVTIPKALRLRFGIHPGTVLDFHEEHGHLVIEKAMEQNPVDQVYGVLSEHRRSEDILDGLRGGK